MRKTLSEYCRQYDRKDLLVQWHDTKNGDLTPADVSYGSQKKIWWQCERGHEWQSPVYGRAEQNHGCPFCAGKRTASGGDFQSLYPELAAQWHPARNGKAKPSKYLPGSHRSVWWQCSKGHEWRALIKSRVEGNGCPYCSGRAVIPGENDLESISPLIAKQWHSTKNGNLHPSQVMPASSRKVWWQCESGHEWQAEIYSRTSGKGCPVCSGKVIIPGENDLESFDPALALQWCRERNGTLSPDRVSVYSNKPVWWQCHLGHQWKAAISNRTFGASGCPYCTNRKVLAGFNDLATSDPLVASQWHPDKNTSLGPDMVMPGSRKRVWWRCQDGHEWKAVIYSRTGAQKHGCPICAGKSPRKYE